MGLPALVQPVELRAGPLANLEIFRTAAARYTCFRSGGFMESHVRILGTLHIVFGSLGLLVAVGFLFLFGSIASVVSLSASTSARDAAIAVPILGGIGTILFVVIGALSLPGLIGGVALVKLAPWSRIFMIVISALDLLSVPIGTAMGIYGIWVLTRPETEALFARRRYQPVG